MKKKVGDMTAGEYLNHSVKERLDRALAGHGVSRTPPPAAAGAEDKVRSAAEAILSDYNAMPDGELGRGLTNGSFLRLAEALGEPSGNSGQFVQEATAQTGEERAKAVVAFKYPGTSQWTDGAPGKGVTDWAQGHGYTLELAYATPPSPEDATTVRVPREPTDDMLVAGQEAWAYTRTLRNAIEDCTEAEAVYKAMIAAAESGE